MLKTTVWPGASFEGHRKKICAPGKRKPVSKRINSSRAMDEDATFIDKIELAEA